MAHRWSATSRSASSTGGCPPPRRTARVKEAIALAGLQGFEDAFPVTLSGGMRQRVALMRSLVAEILLMDEPCGALDTHTKLILHAELLALWEARHQAVVFLTHDLSEAITLADRVPLITMIFGFGLLAKIVLAWSIVFFIVFFNTFQGARSVDTDLIHSARFPGATEGRSCTR